MKRCPAVLVDACPFLQQGFDRLFIAVVAGDHQGIVAIERFRIDFRAPIGQQYCHDFQRVFPHGQYQTGIPPFRFDGIGIESLSQQFPDFSWLVVFGSDEPVVEGAGLDGGGKKG